jgi:alkylation response protein AidB-like acyl-CoA dehydrogenase
MRVAERIGLGGSFAPAAMLQSGIGGLPIVYFGTDDHRARYLEGIMSGETIACYALTEPGSGSDALAARSTAKWDEAKGVYILNGSKQFITGAGFADLFIVFAKIDGDKFTCFILERDMQGLSTGPEEHKMGIKGSSTRALVFENVEVPKENVLGEIGKGHRIAFNVLNIGRLKLTPSVLGGMKNAVREGVKYAKERQQFGKYLADFGLIRQKIAGAATRIYCTESMCYRTADLIDQHIAQSKAAGEADTAKATVAALREFAVECSINKIYGSEALDWIVDEMLQVHGGYGYIQEYAIEGQYRDARINRIWEGTSEINRMLITGTLVKRAMAGELPLLGAIQQLTAEAKQGGGVTQPTDGFLGTEQATIANAKKAALLVAGTAAQRFMAKLEEQQEILGWIADMIMQTFAMESALLRTLKLQPERDAGELEARAAAVRYAVEEGMQIVEHRAHMVLAATLPGEKQAKVRPMLDALTRRQAFDLVDAGHRLASYVLDNEKYPFA